MELSKLDRLANQHAILEKLDEQNADHHAHMRKVYENGYAINYSDDFENIYDEFSREESGFVIDVLDMYSAMQRSWKQLGSPDDLNESDLRFPGFDGNNETSYMAYAKFVVKDEDRFTDLNIFDFNSHMHMLDSYRSMVNAWKQKGTPERYKLSLQGIKDILDQ